VNLSVELTIPEDEDYKYRLKLRLEYK
jgi:hypothetical protein